MLKIALSGAPGAVIAAQPPSRAPLPPIHPLGAVVARSTEQLGNLPAAVLLRDGRVLAYDGRARRVVMFDPSLGHAKTVIDSTTPRTGSRTVGPPFATLIALPGDSAALLEASSGSLIVIDPAGTVARTAVLQSTALTFAAAAAAPKPMVDARGRLLFRAPPPFFLSMLPDGYVGDTIIAGPDSFPLLRFDPATTRTDTVVMVRAPRIRQAVTKRERGGRGASALDPVPSGGDDWVQLADGTIAIVRIDDYHVDWLRPNGTVTRGPPVAHEWSAITDSMKVALVAAARAAMGAARADSLFPIDSARYDSLALVAAANPDAIVGPDGRRTALGPAPQRVHFVSPGDLPGHWPPFTSGGTVADVDGTLWVQAFPVTKPGGGQVYDVIAPTGVLADRVELPAGAALLGVAHGVALLRVRTPAGAALATARMP